MYTEVGRTHLVTFCQRLSERRVFRKCATLYLRPTLSPQTLTLRHCLVSQSRNGDSQEATNYFPVYPPAPYTVTEDTEPKYGFCQRQAKTPKQSQYVKFPKFRGMNFTRYLVFSYRRRTCAQILSTGHSSSSIADQWRAKESSARISAVGAYLVSTRRDRILLRMLEGYMLIETSRKRRVDINAGSKVLIWCIENIHRAYRSKTISFGSARQRAERISALIIRMSQRCCGPKYDPVSIGAYRIRFLLHFLAPESTFGLYSTLLLSRSEVPERIFLSILHILAKAGMFIQALQVFQRLTLSPAKHQNSSLLRTWQFRRLFLKFYRAGIPVHKADIMEFISSFGLIDPLIYKLLVYTAAGVNDFNMALRLMKDYRNQTGEDLPLDVMSSIFLMHHRLGDGSSLNNIYKEAHNRGLQPLSNTFFVTAVMLVESHKDNASYWDLCGLYKRFFSPLALNLLELPLPNLREISPSRGAFLEPSIGTLTIMLNSYLRTVAGKLEGSRYALVIYKRYIDLLRSKGYIPQFKTASEHFLACIISAVARYKPNMELALGIVQDMIDFDDLPQPTSLTWDSLLRASICHSDVGISEKIWEAMLEHGIPPTTHTYSSMIILYTTTDNHDKSDVLRSRMAQEGWSPTPQAQHVLEIVERKRKYEVSNRIEKNNRLNMPLDLKD